jgi:hypothetical protein
MLTLFNFTWIYSYFKACAPELWLCPHMHHLGVRLRGELCFMSQLSSPSLCCLPLGQSQAHAPEECAWDLGRFIHDISWSAPSSSVFSELALTLACRDHYSRCLWPEGQGLSCEFLLLLSQRGVCSGFPGGASGKRPSCQRGRQRDEGSIPESGRSPGGGYGHPLQYSCLENPMAEEPGGLQSMGSWWATVHRAAKSWTRLKWPSIHARTLCSPSMQGWKRNENNKNRNGKPTLVRVASSVLFACLFIFGCTGASLLVSTSGGLLVASLHVGSSQSRYWTHVPCIGRWILNHWSTREYLLFLLFLIPIPNLSAFAYSLESSGSCFLLWFRVFKSLPLEERPATVSYFILAGYYK